MYEKGIGKITVSEYNWLNFFLTKKDKLDMLVKGAGATTDFLMDFDRQDYKMARADLQEQMNIAKPVVSNVAQQETINV